MTDLENTVDCPDCHGTGAAPPSLIEPPVEPWQAGETA